MFLEEYQSREWVVNSIDLLGRKYNNLCYRLGRTPCDFSSDAPLLEKEKSLDLAVAELYKERDERIKSVCVMLEDESNLCERLGVEPLNIKWDKTPMNDQLDQLRNHITFLKNELVRQEKFVPTRNAAGEVMQQLETSDEICVDTAAAAVEVESPAPQLEISADICVDTAPAAGEVESPAPQLKISSEICVDTAAAAGEVESPAPNKPLTLRYSYKDGSCVSLPLRQPNFTSIIVLRTN